MVFFEIEWGSNHEPRALEETLYPLHHAPSGLLPFYFARILCTNPFPRLTCNTSTQLILNQDVFWTDPKACSEKLKSRVPEYLLTSSGLKGNENLTMGTSVQLKCPQHLQLTKDDDDMDEFDNQYTILCNSR